jgi:hypothetical protein
MPELRWILGDYYRNPDKGSDQLLGRIWRGYGCGAASAIRRAADVSAHISLLIR